MNTHPGVSQAAEIRLGSDDTTDSSRTAYIRRRKAWWDDFAATFDQWERLRNHYLRRLAELYQFVIPPGQRVLELGSGTGDLLAAVKPSYGVGIDFSIGMVELARQRHPQLRFIEADVHTFDLAEKFDYIICSDLVNDLWDVQQVLTLARAHSPGTGRLVLNCHSRLWAGPRRVGEFLGLVSPQLPQNWLTVEDLRHLLALTEFEAFRATQEIMCPLPIPFLDRLCNRYLVKLWPFRWLGLTNVIVARPMPVRRKSHALVSVVVPARNEAGNIAGILDRVPLLGAGTELIFVEGNSTDGTYEAIQREIVRRPGCGARLLKQPGRGKGDAVRAGFAHAKGDLFMILDADLTVSPEDLPRFYDAWHSGKGDFINGVRLVYPMEDAAMRFLNLLGNKFFGLAFSWLLGQTIKDSLCGTKVLSREHYEVIAANRSYFGDFDPFGDFDLLFGAARYSFRILDLPIRYRERTYGESNIRRWRHGILLLRMTAMALFRIKFV